MRRILWISALVGFVFLVGATLLVAWFVHTDVRFLSDATSPDGKWVARAVVNMGGGAAGFCYKCVVVQEASQPFVVENATCRSSALLIECGSGTLDLVWASSTSLRVAHSDPGKDVSMYSTEGATQLPIEVLYVGPEYR